MENKAAFYQELKLMLYATNGTCAPDSNVLGLYWSVLKDQPDDKVLAALRHFSETSVSHVPPAQVLKHVTGRTKKQVNQEFDEVVGLIRKHGVAGARARLDHDSKTWRVIKSIGGLNTFNSTNLSEVRSMFYQEFDK